MIWNDIVSLVKRNFWTLAVMIILAVAYPWTLIISIPIALGAVAPILLKWYLQRKANQMFGQANNTQESHSQQRRRNDGEGEVTIIETTPTKPRVNDDVGEYVDFKEIKD
jgi:uncharacterized membrane protein